MPKSRIAITNYGDIGGIQATRSLVDILRQQNMISIEDIIEQLQVQYVTEQDVHESDTVEFSDYILWQLVAAGYSVSIGPELYSNGTPTYASLTQLQNGDLQVLHGIWNGSSSATIEVTRGLTTTPSLPTYFEITGTLHIVCNDSAVAGQGVAAPNLFFGFANSGDPSQQTTIAGIIVDVTDQFINVYPITTSGPGTSFSYTQPIDVTLNYKIRKDASGWYAEVSDNTNTYSSQDSTPISPEIFQIMYGETITTLPLNERTTTTISINITSL